MELMATSQKEKTSAKRIRREGKIPAIVYNKGETSTQITIEEPAFRAILRGIRKGHLSTTRLTLTLDGKKIPVVVKEVQYHPTTYNILHIDFEKLIDDALIDLNIPIEFEGAVDCVGIKLGGFLRPVIRKVKVRCLPKNIPSFFSIDVRKLKLQESKRIADIEIPEGVQCLGPLEEVAVVIAKR